MAIACNLRITRIPLPILAQWLFVALLSMPFATAVFAEESLTESDLQQRMEDSLDRLLIEEGQRKAEAQRLVDIAVQNMRLEQYEDAKRRLENAAALDPTNKAARERLQEVNALLPSSPNDGTDIIRRAEHTEIIRKRHNLAEVKNLLSLAADKLERASIASGGETDAAALRKSIQLLQQASNDLESVNLKVKILSTDMNVDEQRSRAISLQRSIKGLLEELTEREKEATMTKAYQEMKANSVREQQYLQDQQTALIKKAKLHMEYWQWEQAKAILLQVLDQTPGHREADQLLRELKEKQLANRQELLQDKAEVERKTILQDIAEKAIPDPGTINYPSDWLEMIRRREEERDVTISGDLPPWKIKIYDELKKTLPALNFDDSTIYEVAETLRTQTGLNIIVDLSVRTFEVEGEDGFIEPLTTQTGPGGFEDDGEDIPTVTLNVSNMKLEHALDWIMLISDLSYKVEREAIVIGEPDSLGGDMVLEVYDVTDLIEQIDNATALLDGDDDDDDGAESDIDLEDIIVRISPDTWSEGRGRVRRINNNNQFAITQTEDVHSQIKEVLAKLRAAQAIQVAIAARFLDIQDTFFEEFNSEFPIISNHMTASSSPDGTYKLDENEQFGPVYDNTDPIRRQDPLRGKHYTWAGGSTSNLTDGALASLFGSTTVPAAGEGMQFLLTQPGWMGKLRLQWFLQMVRYSAAADVLFAPHLVVYNNKLGSIQIGTQRSFVSGYEVGDGGGLSQEIEQNDATTTFEVRPTVTSDKRFIDLDIRTEVNQFISSGLATIPTEGDDDDSFDLMSIDLITERVQETYTTATVPDGGTILISGLSANINSRTKSGIPILADLPIIGKAFSLRNTQKDKRNLMILINARMILLDESEAALIR